MRPILYNWKSTIAGAILLSFAAVIVWRDPSLWRDPQVAALVAAGAGFLVTKDADNSRGGARG